VESIPQPDPVASAPVEGVSQRVTVRNVAGKLLAIEFTPDMDISQFTAAVSSKTGLAPETFWMNCAGKPLLAGRSCATYGFQSGGTVQLVLRQRGG
jgi:hypothetical protein